MTSLTQALLVAEVGGLIGDPTNLTFSVTQIKDWINQAIRDLSIHFPMIEDYQINTVLNDHDYDLETYIKGVISVEYPVGNTPPRYLKRSSYTDPKFYLEAGLL